ncbi:MAG: glycosyltransferase [Methylocystis sp.]
MIEVGGWHWAMVWGSAVFWSISVATLIVSTFATIAQPWLAARRGRNREQPTVSVVVPVKVLEDNFDQAQESIFAQHYPAMEVLASAVDLEGDAALAMRAVFARHPDVATRFLWSTAKFAKSPKVDNLVAPFTQAANDTILMKDANSILEPDDLAEHMRQLNPDVGLVCAIPYGADPKNIAANVEASIMNGPHARMLYTASALGHGFGVGKIMLFRRGDFLRAGGFAAISHTVGEDNAMAKALARIGLRTVFSHRPVRQELGLRSLDDVYQRQLRWSVIRRGDALLSFLAEPFCQAFPAVIAAAIAAPLVQLTPMLAAGATLLPWFALETWLSFMKGWRVSWEAPAIFLLREAVMLAVWLRAWTTNRVVWAKERFDARAEAAPATLDAPLANRKRG